MSATKVPYPTTESIEEMTLFTQQIRDFVASQPSLKGVSVLHTISISYVPGPGMLKNVSALCDHFELDGVRFRPVQRRHIN